MLHSPWVARPVRSLRPFVRQGHSGLGRPQTAEWDDAEGKRAFTLLEILLALAILGMLVGLAVFNVGGILGDASGSAAKIFVNSSIKIPLTSYRVAMGDYPSTAEGLQALITAPAAKAEQWHGPYFSENKIPTDPWGEPYGYRYPGVKNPKGYDIFSKGADKVEGTADDIGNW